MIQDPERQRLLTEYSKASRTFADAVERLQSLDRDVESFILALEETGAAHRASERSRIRFQKHMAQRSLEIH